MTVTTNRWDDAALPRPTQDRARLEADLDEFGYCIVARALAGAALDQLRQRLVEQVEGERALAIDYKNPANIDPLNQWVNMLLNKGEAFQRVLGHPTIDGLTERLLGPGFLLSTLDAHVVRPGAEAMPLHTDQWWMPPPVAPGTDYPRPAAMKRAQGVGFDPDARPATISAAMVCNIMWLVSDFTEEIGATRVVPRSHLSGAAPDPSVPHRIPSVAAVGPAGTAYLLDGRTWHGAGANVGEAVRYGITTTACAPQCRPLENYTRGLRPEVMAGMAPALLARLGFATWSSYGHTGDPDTLCSLPGDQVLGELRPESD